METITSGPKLFTGFSVIWRHEAGPPRRTEYMRLWSASFTSGEPARPLGLPLPGRIETRSDLFASLCVRARTIGGRSYFSGGPACGSRSEKDGQAFSVPVPSAAGPR
jgi:hypothetical protein